MVTNATGLELGSDLWAKLMVCLGTGWAADDVCDCFTLVGLTSSACWAEIVVVFMCLGISIPLVVEAFACMGSG